MADDQRHNSRRNIVLFPFMAQGHIIPFLALAHQLQKSENCSITLVTTELNIPRISSSLPPNSDNIRILAIPFCGSGHGLPPGVENTDALPYHLIPNLFDATLSLKPHFRALVSDLVSDQTGPICIISDMFFGWCDEIAREFGVFHAMFFGGSAYGFACFHSLWLNLPHRNVGDSSEETFVLPDFPEASGLHVTQMTPFLRATDGTDRNSMFMQKVVLPKWSNADAVLFNTVEELEANTGLLYFRRKFGRPVWPVGPVVLPVARKEDGITSEMCTKWLDSKPARSVLYVSFGSQNTISQAQMMDLAMALESSCKNFIWIVRPPIGFDINGEFRAEEWLPKGFKVRIRESNRGLLVHKWAPQVDILCHNAVSAFLSHCGWNSVIEALTQGLPIIGWPLAAEQFYNAKFLEQELGVCAEVARGMSSRVGHEEMVKKIELVMNVETQKGSEIRRKASAVRDIMRNAMKDENGIKGSSVKAIDRFLDDALLKSVRND